MRLNIQLGRLGLILHFPLLPMVIFLVAAIMSFATGSFWGTFAICMPIALPLAFQYTGGTTTTLVVACFAAVAGGGVFGDHCSPLSDTTILAAEFPQTDLFINSVRWPKNASAFMVDRGMVRSMRRGLTTYNGYLTHEETSGIQGRPWIRPEVILGIEGGDLDPAPRATQTRSDNFYS